MTRSVEKPEAIERFNNDFTHWHPEPSSHAPEYFENLRERVAPERSDIVTWFDVLGLDEGLPVPVATSLN